MANIKGWTLVLLWSTAGLSMWFFSSIWPGLNAWAKENQHLSGWMQFIGSVIGLVAAYHLGTRQAAAARALAREQQVVEALRTFETVNVILDNAHFVLTAYVQEWNSFSVPPYSDDHGEWIRISESIAAIDAFRCPSANLVGMLVQLPKHLDAAIEARDEAMDVYFGRGIGAINPKPPLTPLMDKMFNKIALAKSMLQIAIEANQQAMQEVRTKLPH